MRRETQLTYNKPEQSTAQGAEQGDETSRGKCSTKKRKLNTKSSKSKKACTKKARKPEGVVLQPRLAWTYELHQQFLEAIIIARGKEKAITPVIIREIMMEKSKGDESQLGKTISNITRNQVSSHLQKFRDSVKPDELSLKRTLGLCGLANVRFGTQKNENFEELDAEIESNGEEDANELGQEGEEEEAQVANINPVNPQEYEALVVQELLDQGNYSTCYDEAMKVEEGGEAEAETEVKPEDEVQACCYYAPVESCCFFDREAPTMEGDQGPVYVHTLNPSFQYGVHPKMLQVGCYTPVASPFVYTLVNAVSEACYAKGSTNYFSDYQGTTSYGGQAPGVLQQSYKNEEEAFVQEVDGFINCSA